MWNPEDEDETWRTPSIIKLSECLNLIVKDIEIVRGTQRLFSVKRLFGRSVFRVFSPRFANYILGFVLTNYSSIGEIFVYIFCLISIYAFHSLIKLSK